MIVSRERAETAVDQVQDELAAQAPADFVNTLIANDRLRNAVLAFRDGAVVGLTTESDATMLERKLLVLKREVIAAAPDSSYTLEKLLARAVQSIVSVARGG